MKRIEKKDVFALLNVLVGISFQLFLIRVRTAKFCIKAIQIEKYSVVKVVTFLLKRLNLNLPYARHAIKNLLITNGKVEDSIAVLNVLGKDQFIRSTE